MSHKNASLDTKLCSLCFVCRIDAHDNDDENEGMKNIDSAAHSWARAHAHVDKASVRIAGALPNGFSNKFSLRFSFWWFDRFSNRFWCQPKIALTMLTTLFSAVSSFLLMNLCMRSWMRHRLHCRRRRENETFLVATKRGMHKRNDEAIETLENSKRENSNEVERTAVDWMSECAMEKRHKNERKHEKKTKNIMKSSRSWRWIRTVWFCFHLIHKKTKFNALETIIFLRSLGAVSIHWLFFIFFCTFFFIFRMAFEYALVRTLALAQRSVENEKDRTNAQLYQLKIGSFIAFGNYNWRFDSECSHSIAFSRTNMKNNDKTETEKLIVRMNAFRRCMQLSVRLH